MLTEEDEKYIYFIEVFTPIILENWVLLNNVQLIQFLLVSEDVLIYIDPSKVKQKSKSDSDVE